MTTTQAESTIDLGKIDWKKMGVFTDDSMYEQLLIIYVISIIGFFMLYYLSKMIFPTLVRLIAGPESCFFNLNEKK